MKKQYTKKQIQEAINYWTKRLNESVDYEQLAKTISHGIIDRLSEYQHMPKHTNLNDIARFYRDEQSSRTHPIYIINFDFGKYARNADIDHPYYNLLINGKISIHIECSHYDDIDELEHWLTQYKSKKMTISDIFETFFNNYFNMYYHDLDDDFTQVRKQRKKWEKILANELKTRIKIREEEPTRTFVELPKTVWSVNKVNKYLTFYIHIYSNTEFIVYSEND